MKAKFDTRTIAELLELRTANMLYANPEYQRGTVWTPAQKKRLVDSVLRGYPIPLIYLHHITKEVAKAKRDDFEIIDGQQRINALYEYREGSFKLFDPIADEEEARYPSFIKNQPCAWGGKRFDELSPALQTQLLETPLKVAFIETNISNEARDLFIRLQAGMPLNSQEKRDAWPGNFTEYILKLAGKPEIPRYPGHEFFTDVMKAKANKRGEFRQLAAQMVMLYLTRKRTGRFCDINRDAIDSFYHEHLDFNASAPEVKRFSHILDELSRILADGKRKKVGGHEAMGLILLVDSLLEDYAPTWRAKLADAFDMFRLNVAKGAAARYDTPDEFWLKYGVLTRTNSDRADTIERRHQFLTDKMLGYLKPQLKDPTRAFGELERELIYFRDERKCQLKGCGADVEWSDAEIHHVQEHSKGGSTALENGALVHKWCHPKGAKAVHDFAVYWGAKAKAHSAGV